MGQSFLLNQVVSGLKPELKMVARMEGNFKQMLIKARFKEAKRRDTIPKYPKPPFKIVRRNSDI